MEQKQDALYPIIIGLILASTGALVIGFYFNGYFSLSLAEFRSIAELQTGTNWLLLAIWLMLLSGFMSIERINNK